jgi:hypothetical protein
MLMAQTSGIISFTHIVFMAQDTQISSAGPAWCFIILRELNSYPDHFNCTYFSRSFSLN